MTLLEAPTKRLLQNLTQVFSRLKDPKSLTKIDRRDANGEED